MELENGDLWSGVLARTVFLIPPSSALLTTDGAETPSGLTKCSSTFPKIKIYRQVDSSAHHKGGKCDISRGTFDSYLRANISYQGPTSPSPPRAPAPLHHTDTSTPAPFPLKITYFQQQAVLTPPFLPATRIFLCQHHTKTQPHTSTSRTYAPPAAFYSWSPSSLGPRCNRARCLLTLLINLLLTHPGYR